MCIWVSVRLWPESHWPLLLNTNPYREKRVLHQTSWRRSKHGSWWYFAVSNFCGLRVGCTSTHERLLTSPRKCLSTQGWLGTQVQFPFGLHYASFIQERPKYTRVIRQLGIIYLLAFGLAIVPLSLSSDSVIGIWLGCLDFLSRLHTPVTPPHLIYSLILFFGHVYIRLCHGYATNYSRSILCWSKSCLLQGTRHTYNTYGTQVSQVKFIGYTTSYNTYGTQVSKWNSLGTLRRTRHTYKAYIL